MKGPSSIAEIDQMIRDQVQENVHLDYKASKAISQKARDEIAKDVSAFANSDGGVLIYGVAEKDHLPVRIDDGVDDSVCSREWIENIVTSGIVPKVNDVRILPLPVSPGRSLYVISVAKSFRGPHQASDKRFYKRHNFKSEPMEEYEINDVRNRRERFMPLVTFEVFDYHRVSAAFDVSNVSELVVQDVDFAFVPDIPWTNRGKPPLFANGIRRFPPKQQFRFLYFTFAEILNGGKQIPTEFSVSISYYHPELGRRVTDECKRLERGSASMPLLSRPNQEWSIDFVSDSLATGRAIRVLTVLDDFTKESPVIAVDNSISGPRVTRVLDGVIDERGLPEGLRLDNGPEFTSRYFVAWAAQRGIPLIHIQPGKPVQNSYIESFNGRFRDECLNTNWFENLADARRKIEVWREDYNQHRPHSSLAYRTPAEFAQQWAPSPSLIVIEQSGTSVKDSLRRAEEARP